MARPNDDFRLRKPLVVADGFFCRGQIRPSPPAPPPARRDAGIARRRQGRRVCRSALGGSSSGVSDGQFVAELHEKTRELESLLDAYSERLRRMRQRNRELEEEISSFEAELDRLREWLAGRLEDNTA